MRIGLFTDIYLPRINGLSFTVQFAQEELTKLGHEVHIFAPATNLRGRQAGDTKYVHRVPAIEGIFYSNQFTSFFFPPAMQRKIQKLDLDVIHIFSPGQVGMMGVYVAVRQDIPLISQYGTDVYAYARHYPSVLPVSLLWMMASPVFMKLSPRETAQATKALKPRRSATIWQRQLASTGHILLHSRCAAVIALSPKMKQQLQKWNPTANIVLLPNGVDQIRPLSPAAPADFRKKYKIPKNHTVLLYVGRLGREKNLDLLIDSFALVADKFPNTTLLLVGSHDHEDSLKTRAAALTYSDRIVFTGEIERNKLGAVYGAADIFLFPSLTDTQGLVINEAAAAGLPIVLCDQNLSEVFIEGQTGLLAENKAKKFAAVIAELLSDSVWRKKLGSKARQEAAKYTEAKQAKKLEAVYRSVIAAGKP